MNSEKYTTKQVAKRLNVSVSTVVTYCQEGKIKATKIPMAGGRGFKYLIEGDDFLNLIKDLPTICGPRESGSRIGPFRITRLTNGDLRTVRV